MDLEDFFKGTHRRERRDHRALEWSRGRDMYRDRGDARHGRRAPPVALVLLRALAARPWLLAAAAGVLLVLLVFGIWVSILLLGYIDERGVKGLAEAALDLGRRLWEGRAEWAAP